MLALKAFQVISLIVLVVLVFGVENRPDRTGAEGTIEQRQENSSKI